MFAVAIWVQSSASMATENHPDVSQRVCRFGTCSVSLSRAEADDIWHYVVAGLTTLVQNVSALVLQGQGMPALLQYSCDTTPVKRRAVVSQKHGDLAVKCSGKACTDFLVQQMFLTVCSGGGLQHGVVFGLPIPLWYGKKLVNLAACSLQCPGLDTIACSGCSVKIHHQVYDRGVSARLAHFLSGHWAKLSQQAGVSAASPATASSTALPEMFFMWHTFVSCCLHDAHNALRWSSPLFWDEELLKSIYVAVSAMRSAFISSAMNLGSWLIEVVEFCDASALPSEDDLESLWRALGVEPHLQQRLVDMRLIYRCGRLQVTTHCLCKEDWLPELSATLLSLWKFSSFTASRWATVGCCCRTVCVALLTGYDSLVLRMHREGVLSHFDYNGCAKLDGRGKHCVVAVGMIADSAGCVSVSAQDAIDCIKTLTLAAKEMPGFAGLPDRREVSMK